MATKKKENNENTKVSGKKAEASAVNNAEAEAAREKFQEKLKELLSLAKKKKNMLEYQEISDFFADMQLDSDKFEKILDFLEANYTTHQMFRDLLTEKYYPRYILQPLP